MKILAAVLQSGDGSREGPDLTQQLAEAALRLSPQVAVGDHCVFIEIGKSLNLYSEKVLLLRLRSLLERLKIRARVGLGENIPEAKAQALFQRADLPIEALQIYASPFKTSESLDGTILNLRQLGILKLADFSKLPVAEVTTRFGKSGLMARHYLDQARHVVWPWFQVSEKLIEKEAPRDGLLIREFEPILFMLRKIVDRALLRLFGQGRLATEVRVRIRLEHYTIVKNPVRDWNFDFAFPQSSVFGVLPILRERIERDLQVTPFESAVESIEFEILKGVPSQGRQRDFLNRKEEEQEEFNSVVARLIDKLGIENVFMASAVESYFPERAWKKTLDIQNFQNLESYNLPERPLRLLKTPQKISRLDDYFFVRDHRWRVVEIKEYERLSGDWWVGQEERDYFRAEMEGGEELWIYCESVTQEYFLHGIFD